MIGKVGGGIVLFTLLIGAVLAAGSTVHASYFSAQLARREQAALAKQRLLREELAQAQSLQEVVRYAAANGLERTEVLASLDLSASLAQR